MKLIYVILGCKHLISKHRLYDSTIFSSKEYFQYKDHILVAGDDYKLNYDSDKELLIVDSNYQNNSKHELKADYIINCSSFNSNFSFLPKEFHSNTSSYLYMFAFH